MLIPSLFTFLLLKIPLFNVCIFSGSVHEMNHNHWHSRCPLACTWASAVDESYPPRLLLLFFDVCRRTVHLLLFLSAIPQHFCLSIYQVVSTEHSISMQHFAPCGMPFLSGFYSRDFILEMFSACSVFCPFFWNCAVIW